MLHASLKNDLIYDPTSAVEVNEIKKKTCALIENITLLLLSEL